MILAERTMERYDIHPMARYLNKIATKDCEFLRKEE